MVYSLAIGHSRSAAYRLAVPNTNSLDTPSSFSWGTRSAFNSQPDVCPALTHGPDARIARGAAGIEAQRVLQRDRLVVAADRTLQRGPTVAEHVVDHRRAWRECLEVWRSVDVTEALLRDEDGLRLTARRLPSVGRFESKADVHGELSNRCPAVLEIQTRVAVGRCVGTGILVEVDAIGTLWVFTESGRPLR